MLWIPSAAKQEAFEESIRLKNQFRSLDEDEVEFLDSVLESTRAKEAALKKETEEQLEVFRKQQENADRALLNDDDGEKGRGEVDTVDNGWKTTSRKRRRVGEKEGLKGVKLRKSSSTSGTPDDARQKQGGTVAETSPGPHAPAGVDLEHTAAESATTTGQSTAEKAPIAASPTVQRAAKGLLSVDYGSDDDGEWPLTVAAMHTATLYIQSPAIALHVVVTPHLCKYTDVHLRVAD